MLVGWLILQKKFHASNLWSSYQNSSSHFFIDLISLDVMITRENEGIEIQQVVQDHLQNENEDAAWNDVQLGNSSLPTSPSQQNATYSLLFSSASLSTRDLNWQAKKHSLRERNAAMFNNDLMSDIRFLVGPQGTIHFMSAVFIWFSSTIISLLIFFFLSGNAQKIPAHKYVLATGSSVFYAMFYGGLAESEDEIKVPDVEPPAFLILLKLVK